MAKRGRPKGSKNKTIKDVVVETPTDNKRVVMRPVMTGNKFVAADGTVFEENVFYSFKNRLEGPFFYKGDDGSDKKIDGLTVRRDITPREREDIIGCDTYANGGIVEWSETYKEPANYNALSDLQIDRILKEYRLLDDKDRFKAYIDNMNSIFALRYFTDKITPHVTGSIVKYCESRIAELEEAEREKHKEVAKPHTKIIR